MVVTGLVSLAARSWESLLTDSAETLERLAGSLGLGWLVGASPSPNPTGGDQQPWWTTPEPGDSRFVDLDQWTPAPAGPWGAC